MDKLKPLNERLPIQLRPANPEDIPFIFNSWLKSFRNAYFARQLINTVYFTEQHKVIEKLVKESTILIACNAEEPSQVYGWICAGIIDGITSIHYVYVKHSFRSLGIASLLLDAIKKDKEVAGIYTHHTKAADRLASKLNLLYHPYVLFSTYKKGE